MRNILIVDDEVDFARGLSRLIASGLPELDISLAHNGHEALERLETTPVSVLLLDLSMPGPSGMEVIARAREKYPDLTIIVLTAHGTVETAVSALKQGAWDFLTKPVRRDDLLHTLNKALEHSRLLGENLRLRQLMAQSGLERSLIGDSAAMRRLKERIGAVASSAYTVLVHGESGTGKELVAEGIHNLSDRKSRPFVRVNCPAIPEQLLESELFGHVKGAFTGADSAHKGLFMQAMGGTLLLDEVGDIPLGIQTKLLRTLQDGEVRPVGAARPVTVDVRIVAATNQDLEKKIKQGAFREDLFYRLNVLTIQTPSLRERRDDIPLLCAHFLGQACAEMAVAPKRIAPEAMAVIRQQDWPGNVRELQNLMRRVAVFSAGAVIELADVSLAGLGGRGKNAPAAPDVPSPYKEVKNRLVDSFTRAYMEDLLKKTGGNISEAARLSGLGRVSMQKILRRLGMDGVDFRK